jgi:hypothetical protein
MSKIAYHGEGAGLGRVERGGDRNSAANYVLTCACGLELGPLGGHRQDDEGRRAIGCPRCLMATIVDKNGQILKHLPISVILEMQKKAAGQ